ncbi:MAG: twin transmembrane helix small protein [Gammaproteobacteria bacterium]|nr:twin transmembrane helix small protein [Gammaproteobacteria bacterium]
MMVKIVIIVMLLLIVGSLFSALLFMFKDKSQSDRMVKALSFRIGLSILLFLMLMAGYYFGIIPPQHS